MEEALAHPYSYEDPDVRSKRERALDLQKAGLTALAIAGFIVARKKVALTRGWAKLAHAVGEGRLGESYARHLKKAQEAAQQSSRLAATRREMSIGKVGEVGSDLRSWVDDLFRKLPTSEEQLNIVKKLAQSTTGLDPIYIPTIDAFRRNVRLREGFWSQIWGGPTFSYYAPGTRIGLAQRSGLPSVVGEGGAILASNEMFLLNTARSASVTRRFAHSALPFTVRPEMVSSWGASVDREVRRRRKFISPQNSVDLIKRVELDARKVTEATEKELIMGGYLRDVGLNVGIDRSKSISEIRAHVEKIREQTDPGIKSYEQWLGTRFEGRIGRVHYRGGITQRGRLSRMASINRAEMARRYGDSRIARHKFKLFKLQEKLGVGEIYAGTGTGIAQRVEKRIKELGGFGYRTAGGTVVDPSFRKYARNLPLSEKVAGVANPFYLSTGSERYKKWASSIFSGTLFRVAEKAFGMGVASRSNAGTEFFRQLFGAQTSSYTNYFLKHISKTGKVMALGFGAYYTYRMIDYLGRQTVGWGPTDVAAEAYTRARMFQQTVVNNVGLVHLAKFSENAFPGSVSSPLSHALRLAAPIGMAYAGSRMAGPKGFLGGLALGIATAMITWGDLTQSPEELKRIFSGEQDIPVRKGRYWLLGRTPFFGGKISYWRQHWYPLLKSRHMTKGGLWESETEQMAQGTPLSPILAPVLTGKMWDPYYWEKKHYFDRPYPVTGELFEPTMPYAWLGNLTIGRVVKPPTLMHRDYLGYDQGSVDARDRYIPQGMAARLGFASAGSPGVFGGQSPHSLSYNIGMAAYSQTEQMGIIGYAANTLFRDVTGRSDFSTGGSVLQSARRATGYERGYWEKELGDPGAGVDEGLTEFFRRFLPHRRKSADEYNPIPNEMPSWMPGSDYFINFRTGDPYTKIPYGEARLPGPGYEALHQLHSGIPGVYDAVDRYLILANVAPYSDEYREYQALAKGMVKGESYWEKRIKQAEMQRRGLHDEFPFLSTSTEGVPLLAKPFSFAYRQVAAAVTNFPNPLDMLPHTANVGPIPTHINKWFPFKTPESTYLDYKLYGSTFAPWDQPVESYIMPYARKLKTYFGGVVDIPEEERKARELDVYFDQLKMIKYSNLALLAEHQGDRTLADQMHRAAKKTMAYGSTNPADIMSAIPRGERSFYQKFSEAEGETRQRISSMVPEYMRPYYEKNWTGDASGISNFASSPAYFKNKYLPPPEWAGWNPDVSIDQVKLKVVKNEAMDIHRFNLWDSQERQLARSQNIPEISDINARSSDMTMLHNAMIENFERSGFNDIRVNSSRTPSYRNSFQNRVSIRRDNTRQREEVMSGMFSF